MVEHWSWEIARQYEQRLTNEKVIPKCQREFTASLGPPLVKLVIPAIQGERALWRAWKGYGRNTCRSVTYCMQSSRNKSWMKIVFMESNQGKSTDSRARQSGFQLVYEASFHYCLPNSRIFFRRGIEPWMVSTTTPSAAAGKASEFITRSATLQTPSLLLIARWARQDGPLDVETTICLLEGDEMG